MLTDNLVSDIVAFPGGRYTSFQQNYRPQLFIRTADVTVGLTFPPGTPDADDQLVMPGDNVELIGDLVHDIALEVGSRFTLREGGKTSKQTFVLITLQALTPLFSRHWHCH